MTQNNSNHALLVADDASAMPDTTKLDMASRSNEEAATNIL